MIHPVLRFPRCASGKNLPAHGGGERDLSLILRLGRSPGEGNGNPPQYSCLENPLDRGAWWGLQRVGHAWAAQTPVLRPSHFTCCFVLWPAFGLLTIPAAILKTQLKHYLPWHAFSDQSPVSVLYFSMTACMFLPHTELYSLGQSTFGSQLSAYDISTPFLG